MSSKPSFKQTQIEFAAHIRDPKKNPKPDGIEDRRMKIYRDLFISSISGLLSGSFPVIRSLYTDSSWELIVRKYFKKEHNKTPHFPEIPREFVEFLRKHPDTDPNKPFLYELAHYEWLELHLEKHSLEIEKSIKPITDSELLQQVPLISSLVRLNSYQFPVHQIKEAYQPTETNEHPLYIAVWRDTDYKINFTEMNPFSALLLESLINNKTLNGQQLLENLAQEHNHPDKEQFVQFGLQAMTQWLNQDIIIKTKHLKSQE